MLAVMMAAALATPYPATASCPMTLPQDALSVRAPAGWAGYGASLMRLSGFGMMAGPPASMSYLIGEGARKAKDGAIQRWPFEKGEEKWLYCTYGGSSAIQISRRLADAATTCTLTHKATKLDGITEMRAECR